MILYFSGTGNSGFVAEKISETLDDEIINLNSRIKNNDTSEIKSEKPFVICVPTYAWKIPNIVKNHLIKTPFVGNKKVYFVMTCGEDNGNAVSDITNLCSKKNLKLMGCIHIVMPENYIAMFSSPSDSQAQKIIESSLPKINSVAETIKNNQPLPNKKINIVDILKSSIINKAFYFFCVKASGFYSTDKCISCGKCVNVCPLNNIKLVNGKPVWGKDCTHCMACICRCPKEAIEYSNKSKGQNRYICKFEDKTY